MQKVVKEWNGFPAEVVSGPRLSVTKMHLDSAPNKRALTFGQSCSGQAVGQDVLHRSFPTENIPF